METGIIEYDVSFEEQMIMLILSIQNEEFQVGVTIDDQPDLKNIAGFYRSGKGNFWIAVQNGQVVGTIGIKDIGNNAFALRKMFVHLNSRGKEAGVAQKLLEKVFDWSRQQMITDIYLGTIDRFIAAQKFYEKNGFERVDKQNLPVNFPVMKVDNIFYHRQMG